MLIKNWSFFESSFSLSFQQGHFRANFRKEYIQLPETTEYNTIYQPQAKKFVISLYFIDIISISLNIDLLIFGLRHLVMGKRRARHLGAPDLRNSSPVCLRVASIVGFAAISSLKIDNENNV